VNEEPQTPTDYVANWIATHQREIGGSPIKFDRREEHSSALNAGFETPKFLIDICAWDHACCLDILVLNKKSGGTDYMVCGECDGLLGLAQRLETFLRWLNENESDRNPSPARNPP